MFFCVHQKVFSDTKTIQRLILTLIVQVVINIFLNRVALYITTLFQLNSKQFSFKLEFITTMNTALALEILILFGWCKYKASNELTTK